MTDQPVSVASSRVLALCGDMVVVFGMERMSFEILRALRDGGADVHCILNEWENHRIQPLAESIGASWSIGRYGYHLRRTRNPLRLLSYAWQIARTSWGFFRDLKRFRATHVFVPEFGALLKNAPALIVTRAIGIPVILRLPTAPSRGRFYDRLWRYVIPPLTSTIVAQSGFTLGRCREVGVPLQKTTLIPNTIPQRTSHKEADRSILALARLRRTLLCVGQIAPFKGTHLAVEAALELLDRGDDLQLMVAGAEATWPPERVDYIRAMQREVKERGYDDRVRFVGDVENVPKLMEVCYVLVAPILQEESFGLVMLEAKSVGLPVVGFRRGAIPELVEHERTGYLCRDTDCASLIEGLDYFLGDPDAHARAAAASRRSYLESASTYSPEAFAGRWRELFR